MRLPRWIHRLYAWIAGYFWLPCPICARKFGGHEWLTGDPRAYLRQGPDDAISEGICPSCTRARQRADEAAW